MDAERWLARWIAIGLLNNLSCLCLVVELRISITQSHTGRVKVVVGHPTGGSYAGDTDTERKTMRPFG